MSDVWSWSPLCLGVVLTLSNVISLAKSSLCRFIRSNHFLSRTLLSCRTTNQIAPWARTCLDFLLASSHRFLVVFSFRVNVLQNFVNGDASCFLSDSEVWWRLISLVLSRWNEPDEYFTEGKESRCQSLRSLIGLLMTHGSDFWCSQFVWQLNVSHPVAALSNNHLIFIFSSSVFTQQLETTN